MTVAVPARARPVAARRGARRPAGRAGSPPAARSRARAPRAPPGGSRCTPRRGTPRSRPSSRFSRPARISCSEPRLSRCSHLPGEEPGHGLQPDVRVRARCRRPPPRCRRPGPCGRRSTRHRRSVARGGGGPDGPSASRPRKARLSVTTTSIVMPSRYRAALWDARGAGQDRFRVRAEGRAGGGGRPGSGRGDCHLTDHRQRGTGQARGDRGQGHVQEPVSADGQRLEYHDRGHHAADGVRDGIRGEDRVPRSSQATSPPATPRRRRRSRPSRARVRPPARAR